MKSCPNCGKNNIAKYLYGMPAMDEELRKDIDKGKIILGGCVIIDESPKFHCNSCSYDWPMDHPGERECKHCGDVVMYCSCYERSIDDIMEDLD
mgnify:FL=1